MSHSFFWIRVVANHLCWKICFVAWFTTTNLFS